MHRLTAHCIGRMQRGKLKALPVETQESPVVRRVVSIEIIYNSEYCFYRYTCCITTFLIKKGLWPLLFFGTIFFMHFN